MNGKKLERPLHLDMPTDEALARFIQTKPEEVEPPPGRPRKGARPDVGRKAPASAPGLANDKGRDPKIAP